MSGHHFMSLFTCIELLVASLLSLTHILQLFSILSPHLPIIWVGTLQCLHALIKYLMGFVPYKYIQFLSLILQCDIFTLILSLSIFLASHIITCNVHLLFLFLIIAYLALSLLYLKWWFFTLLYGGQSYLFLISFHRQWFRDLSLKGCLVSEDSCYITLWGEFTQLGYVFSLEIVQY